MDMLEGVLLANLSLAGSLEAYLEARSPCIECLHKHGGPKSLPALEGLRKQGIASQR